MVPSGEISARQSGITTKTVGLLLSRYRVLAEIGLSICIPRPPAIPVDIVGHPALAIS